MILQDLISFLSQMDPTAVARPAFGEPMSHRADYYELAFEPLEESTAGEMLKQAKSALGETFQGYKGGEYTMNGWTTCNIAPYGRCGEELSEIALRAMFKVPALEAEIERLKAREVTK